MRRMAAGNGALDLVQYAPREERGYCTLQVFFSLWATRAADHHTTLTSLFPSFKARKLVGVLGDTFSFKSFTISSAPPKGGR